MNYFIGQIILFPGSLLPKGNNFMFCNGQILKIAAYQELFSAIGDTYGGNGSDTFALPDLRGRALVHPDSNNLLGKKGGEIEKNFIPSHFPPHSHTLKATIKSSSLAGNQNSPANNYPANSERKDLEYHTTASETYMSKAAVEIDDDVSTEGTRNLKPLSNMQPYLAINFMIKVYK
jgi:microcystin-dependent protein